MNTHTTPIVLPAQTAGIITESVTADTLNWLRAECSKTSQADVARRTGVSATTINRILSGNYQGNLPSVMDKVAACRRAEQARDEVIVTIPFVATSLAKTIATTCDRVRLFGHLTRLIGPSQIGKTWAMRHYAQENPNTLMLTMYNNPNTQTVTRQLCRMLGVPYRQQGDVALDELAPRISNNTLILVDECQQATYRLGRGVTGPLEWLRMLHDRTGCGMILTGTGEFDTATRSGREAQILAQICKRGKAEYLNPYPTANDLRLIYHLYGLDTPSPDAQELLVTMAERNGLGEFCRTLEVVAFNAHAMGRLLTWDFFVEEARRQDENARRYAEKPTRA